MLILAGGHVPTQNKFFERIRLKEHINNFDGILIGISAGTMNCAEVVYAQPELEGESIDKKYERFLSGLGITNFMILPHYQDIKDDILDGQHLFEDITYPDSYGRENSTLWKTEVILWLRTRRQLYLGQHTLSKMER